MIMEATMSLFYLCVFVSLYFIISFMDDEDALMGLFCADCIVMIIYVFMVLLFW